MHVPLYRWLLLVALSLAVVATTSGQEKKVDAKSPPVRRLTVSVGSTVRLRMTTKRPIQTVFNENEHVLRVLPLRDDPTTVLVTGLMPGIARIHLTDIDGKTEIHGPERPKKK